MKREEKHEERIADIKEYCTVVQEEDAEMKQKSREKVRNAWVPEEEVTEKEVTEYNLL